MSDSYEHWVEDYIREGTNREKIWTKPITVGSAEFVKCVKTKLGIKAKHRRIHRSSDDEFSPTGYRNLNKLDYVLNFRF